MRTRRLPFGRAALGIAVVALASTGLVACGDDTDDAASDDTTTTEATAAEVTISDVWARPVEDLAAKDTSAVYMVIEGGDEDDALVGASVPADVATTVEVHETVSADGEMDGDMESGDMESGDMESGDMESTTTMGDMESGDMESSTTMGDMGDEGDMGGGMMTMQPVDSVPVPAGETVELKPGGYHVMLLDVQKELVPGDTIEVTLTFELAGEVTVTAEVREP